MREPSVDVVVLTMNDRPGEETKALDSLLAQKGVDITIGVVGNGCVPDIVPESALSVSLPENLGIPGGRNAGARLFKESGKPSEFIFFLDNDAVFPTDDVLLRLVTEARAHPEAAYIQPRLTGPDDETTPRRWVPRLRASDPAKPGTVTTMTEGVVMVRRKEFDAVGGWAGDFFLYHEGIDLAWKFWSLGRTGWYAAGVRMHHPVTTPARHARFYRLAARNRVWVAYRNLPRPLIPLYLGFWIVATALRSWHGGGRESLKGLREGWAGRHRQRRRPMDWRTVSRLTTAGRPPVI
ncbi:glycosyltransferase family 2 protein [Streptomyces kebangsaanensis]|uniref:glycosyltransferase family 2 protein n=1 Tax=Streptomyces kebangsaanensis TaxID=864058 RepID=UPI00093FF7C0|nr:glycosyltransferase family 2 protein [Streptomyces kebangsaanensis]